MNSRLPALTGVLVAAIVSLLAGCAATSNPGWPGNNRGGNASMSGQPAAAAQDAVAHGDYGRAAQLYIRAAGQASQPDAQRNYRFEAGLAAAQAGDAQTARQMLASINPTALGDVDHSRYNLAQREIAIADLSPEDALAHLPPPSDNTAPAVAERVWEKRASLQFAANQPVAGLQALVQRGAWLSDPALVAANDQRLYDEAGNAVGLGIGPDSPDASQADAVTRGWLALAAIGQRQFASRQDLESALAQWQQAYPGHPANRHVLADTFDYHNTMAVTPVERGMPGNGAGTTGTIKAPNGQVALALPVSGRFENAAQAIRDGFDFAYQNNSAGLPAPLFYDSTNESAASLAARARQDNIGVLVGPLAKEQVTDMAGQSLPIPVVALNTIDQPVQRDAFYQFGLDPADEAASAARHALDQGYHNALVLVPSGEWGQRVLDGFRKTLSGEGGQVLAYRSYNGDSHDHSAAIQQVLGGGNQARADFIFVAAQPTQARLIRSQLKYYDASDLPMVTTSHAFSGQVDRGSDIDLNDVHFVDMPWLLGTGATISRLRSQANSTYGDEATAYARLFAMGMDAWVLAEHAANNQLAPNQPLEGMTGVLSVEPSGHVTRYLGWAVFRNGTPQTIGLPSLSDARNVANFATGTGRSGNP